MKVIKLSLAMAVVMTLVVNCATILVGKNQTVTINSNVTGAVITIDGKVIGKTPFTGEIKRGAKTLKLTKSGYTDKSITFDKKIEPIFFGNVLIGGLFGSSTDFSTGAMYRYAPATIQIDMTRGSGN